jgi:iron complex outermembrane recepter protein
MTPFKLSPVAAAMALLTTLGAAPVWAQSPAAPAAAGTGESQVVEISGIRQSIKSAENIKREALQVVDSINADDIGKFPDRSVGEALQRVAGVQVGRDRGETSSIIIRGLPDVATSLNGNEIFTGSGRRLAYQDLPVQSVAGLDVYKSATANQFEGGIAGAINVRLRAPFDYKGFTATAYADARRSKTEGSANAPAQTDPGFGALVSNRWKTDAGEFGALVDVSYKKDVWGYPVQWNDEPSRIFSVNAAGNGIRLEDNQPIAPLRPGDRLGSLPHVGGIYNTGERERTSFHAALQWKPNAKLELNAQLLSMGFKGRSEADWIFSIAGWAPNISNAVLDTGAAGCTTKLGTICPILSATAPPTQFDPYTATSTQANDERTTTNFGSIGALYRDGALRVVSELALTDSKYTYNKVIVDQQVPNATSSVFTNDAQGHGGFTAITTPTSPRPLQDPRQFVLRGLVQDWGDFKGSQVQWRTDADYKLGAGLLQALQGGVRLASRKASADSRDRFWETPNAERRVPVDVFGASFNRLVPGVDRLGGGHITPSADFLLDNTDVVRAYYGAGVGRFPADPDRFFSQKEQTLTAHLSGKFGFDLGSVDVRGAVGARLIKVDRTLDGNKRVGDVVTSITSKSSETNVLPNVSAVLGWTEKLQSHLSIGKTLTRPDFASLNPALSLIPGTVNTLGSGRAGNPDLKATESVSADITLEYFLEKNGFIQLALFDRRIDGYLQNFSQDETIDGRVYTVSRPQNSGKGKLSGAEFGVQKFFDFLPAPFNGLGAQFNYTLINGSNQTKTTLGGSEFIKTALVGVAKSSVNLALLYEGHGFTGRLAGTRRGAYVEAVNASRFGLDQTVKAATYVDFSLGYAINKNFSVQFDALNLGKAKFESYIGDPSRPRDIRYSPTAYGLGLRFTL